MHRGPRPWTHAGRPEQGAGAGGEARAAVPPVCRRAQSTCYRGRPRSAQCMRDRAAKRAACMQGCRTRQQSRRASAARRAAGARLELCGLQAALEAGGHAAGGQHAHALGQGPQRRHRRLRHARTGRALGAAAQHRDERGALQRALHQLRRACAARQRSASRPPRWESSGPGARKTNTGALRRPAPARSGRPAATSAATRLALRARTVATKLSCSDVASVAGQPIVLKKEQSMPSPLPSPTRSRSWYTCSARSAVQSGARHSACCAIASDASYCTYSARCSGGGGRTHRRGPVGAVQAILAKRVIERLPMHGVLVQQNALCFEYESDGSLCVGWLCGGCAEPAGGTAPARARPVRRGRRRGPAPICRLCRVGGGELAQWDCHEVLTRLLLTVVTQSA